MEDTKIHDANHSKKFVKLKDSDELNNSKNSSIDEDGGDLGDRTLSKERLYYQEKQSRFNKRSNSLDFERLGEGERRSSLYELKNIENPVVTKGNRISSRTNLLFEQYKRDMTSFSSSENLNIEIGDISKREPVDMDVEEKKRAQEIKEEKERELNLVKAQYQKRLDDEQRELEKERENQRLQQEIKSRKSLGAVKNAYLKTAQGEFYKHSDSEDDLDGNDSIQYDKHGVLIEKSGGKEQIVKSSHDINDIRKRFNSIGKSGWKKSSKVDDLVTGDVKSAKTMFSKTGAPEKSSSYVRPVQKKVQDPATLMEQRKKITYGGQDEIPQDGVIKKSVVIDESEIGKTSETLHIYKGLESKSVNQKLFERSFSNSKNSEEKSSYSNGSFSDVKVEDEDN
ncbi:mRNA export factor GLE1 [Hydra vulgaris]|uniref:mRNA export factor GLE1 n=1 Tax=Hydra vulgaris TaxID=6087 RepID=A0ABM4C5P0_HYDVU